MSFPVPGGATFLRARNNLLDVANASQALADLGGLGQQASTGPAGVALQNGTPTFLTWNVPNDGNLHYIIVISVVHVTVAQTGGAVQVVYQSPFVGAVNHFSQLIAGGLGTDTSGQGGTTISALVQPGSTVTVQQTSAQTAGTAQFWAAILGQ